jgi:hypothetical protein
LNPEKCTFGVTKAKLLGFIVFERGIEANPKKIMAIARMDPIHNAKGVQRLTSYLVTLSQFISRLGEWRMPVYKLLKKSDTFIWTEEAQQALDSLKALLTSAPVLIASNVNRSYFTSRRPPTWLVPLLWLKGRSWAVR